MAKDENTTGDEAATSKASESLENSNSSNAGSDAAEAPQNVSDVAKSAVAGGGSGSKIKSATDAIKDPSKGISKFAGDAAKNAAPESVKTVVEAGQKVQQTLVKAKAAVVGAKNFFVLAAVTIFDPVFWIIIGVIVVVSALTVTLMATVQVVGRTENADGCGVAGDSHSSGLPAEDQGNWEDNAKQIGAWLTTTSFEFLGGQPMTKVQAAGVIGNLKHESGGTLNPKTVQFGSGLSVDASNSEIASVRGYNKAVGIVQWDGVRRTELANFASSQGGSWSDLNIQLAFLKSELENPYYGARMVAAGFNESSQGVEGIVRIFVSIFEVPAKDSSGEWLGMSDRLGAGNAFMGFFDGGYSVGSGGSCLMDSGGSFDASDIVSMSVAMSYPNSPASRVGPGDAYGKNKAKPEYIQAKKEAEAIGGKDPATGFYASCDRFVATVVKIHMDPDIPWGSTANQGEYLKNSPKWQQYTTKAEAQPGDVWITKQRGHVVMYLGEVNGVDTIAHASYFTRVAALGNANYLSANLVDTGGRAYYGYRYIGG